MWMIYKLKIYNLTNASSPSKKMNCRVSSGFWNANHDNSISSRRKISFVLGLGVFQDITCDFWSFNSLLIVLAMLSILVVFLNFLLRDHLHEVEWSKYSTRTAVFHFMMCYLFSLSTWHCRVGGPQEPLRLQQGIIVAGNHHPEEKREKIVRSWNVEERYLLGASGSRVAITFVKSFTPCGVWRKSAIIFRKGGRIILYITLSLVLGSSTAHPSLLMVLAMYCKCINLFFQVLLQSIVNVG